MFFIKLNSIALNFVDDDMKTRNLLLLLYAFIPTVFIGQKIDNMASFRDIKSSNISDFIMIMIISLLQIRNIHKAIILS